MRRVRGESGARLFVGKDVLSPQQISGFFSRLAAKIRKSSPPQHRESEIEDENKNVVEAESLHSELHAVVQKEVALTHQIVALSRNICNMVHANELPTLTVGMLREICENLGLNVADVKKKRKQPLIDRIIQVVGDCSCSVK